MKANKLQIQLITRRKLFEEWWMEYSNTINPKFARPIFYKDEVFIQLDGNYTPKELRALADCVDNLNDIDWGKK